MEEKIKSAKVAILERIEKVVKDDSKSLSAEALTTMADIVTAFDSQDRYVKCLIDYLNNADADKEVVKENPVSIGEI